MPKRLLTPMLSIPVVTFCSLLLAGCGEQSVQNETVSEVSSDSVTGTSSSAPADSRPQSDIESPISPAVAEEGSAVAEGESTGSAATSENVPAKPQREPIYDTETPGEELIAAALRKAQRDHKHVLIEWGGNWCGWCYKLHDVFHNNETVHPIVFEEYELVLVNEGNNHDLMLQYGGKDRQYAYPHLTVLDEDGSVLTNQETGSLEVGPKHDPEKVAAFLKQWAPKNVDAEQALADALIQAKAESRHVLLRVGTPYCGWCKVLAQFIQDHEALFAKDYVDLRIDTMRMKNGEAVASRYAPATAGGIPWFVILDSSGKELASSHGPDGNVGYPYQPHEIAHFVSMLRETRSNLTDDELAMIEADLTAYRTKREAEAD